MKYNSIWSIPLTIVIGIILKMLESEYDPSSGYSLIWIVYVLIVFAAVIGSFEDYINYRSN